MIGLTEIEIFDENRRQIKIDPSYIDVALPGSENDCQQRMCSEL